MTPQQLIDLPGYGKAQHQIIKKGDWYDPAAQAQQTARKIAELAEELEVYLEEQQCA